MEVKAEVRHDESVNTEAIGRLEGYLRPAKESGLQISQLTIKVDPKVRSNERVDVLITLTVESSNLPREKLFGYVAGIADVVKQALGEYSFMLQLNIDDGVQVDTYAAAYSHS